MYMRHLLRTLTCVLLLAFVPFGAVDAETAPEGQDNRLESIYQAINGQSRKARNQAMRLIEAWAGEPGLSAPDIARLDGLRGLLLIQSGRYEKGRQTLENSLLHHHNPGFIRTLAQVQSRQNDPVAAIATLNLLDTGDELLGLDPDLVQSIMWRLVEADTDTARTARGDFSIRLAMHGWQQNPLTSAGEVRAIVAVRELALRGRMAEAEALLDRVAINSTDIAAMAMDRRYEGIWPAIERLGGGTGYRALIERDEMRAAAVLEQSPGDPEAVVKAMVMALRAGNVDGAIEIGRPFASDRRYILSGEDHGWVLDYYARALALAGQVDAAIAELEWLVEQKIPDGDMISHRINLATHLLYAGRTEEAWQLYRKLAYRQNNASDYGRMWIWSGKLCAEERLGTLQRRAALLEQLQTKMDKNLDAMMQGHACLGKYAEIEKIMIRRLDDPAKRRDILKTFAHARVHDTRGVFIREMDAIFAAVRAGSAVQEKLMAYGRVIEFDGHILDGH